MAFEVLGIRTTGSDASTLYPVVRRSGRTIDLEAMDGENVRVLPATAVAVGVVCGPGIDQIARYGPVRADIMLTDARVAVACATFEKGGTFRRRTGRVLVGHVRFPWLWQVGASPNQGVRGEGQLRLVLAEDVGGDHRTLALDLTLPRDVDSLEAAQVIARRAARFRLEHTDVPPHQGDELRELTRAQRLRPEAKCFAMYTLPGSSWAEGDVPQVRQGLKGAPL